MHGGHAAVHCVLYRLAHGQRGQLALRAIALERLHRDSSLDHRYVRAGRPDLYHELGAHRRRRTAQRPDHEGPRRIVFHRKRRFALQQLDPPQAARVFDPNPAYRY